PGAEAHADVLLHRNSPQLAKAMRANPYLNDFVRRSGTHLFDPEGMAEAAKEDLGVYYKFLDPPFFKKIFTWTNKEMFSHGMEKIEMDKFMAYMGLEMAASVVRFGSWREYWATGLFQGHPDFKSVMGRDAFLKIRSCLKFYAEKPSLSADGKPPQPLWFSEVPMDTLQANIKKAGVPRGSCGFDELSLPAKKHHECITYCPSKPDKWALRNYGLCSFDVPFLFSFWNNMAAKLSESSAAWEYASMHGFPNLWKKLFHPPTARQHGLKVRMPGTSARALWVMQIVHMSKLDGDYTPGNKRLVVFDNFYTSPLLASVLLQASKKNIYTLGTCCLRNQTSENRTLITEAMEILATKCPETGQSVYGKGSWLLLQAMETEKTSAGTVTKPYENAGYIKINWPSPYIESLIHGLAPLDRWMGDEFLGRTEVMVPMLLVLYIFAMLTCDRVDHYRANVVAARRENRMTMTIWSWIQDMAALCDLSVRRLLNPTTKLGYKALKLQLARAMVMPYMAKKVSKSTLTHRPSAEFMVANVGCMEPTGHVLLPLEYDNENGRHFQTWCYLCYLRFNQRKYTTLGCDGCKKGFHLVCFGFFHFSHALQAYSTNLSTVSTLIDASEQKQGRKGTGQSRTPASPGCHSLPTLVDF
ncbi:unnamed protein product, partial [Heterosigma akashiwo]